MGAAPQPRIWDAICPFLGLGFESGSDPHGTPNADGSGVRGAESNTGVGSDGEHMEGMSMDARIRLRVDKHAGGP